MLKYFQSVIISCFFIFLSSLDAQNHAELLFTQKCAACHTIGKGRLIGPDLANVQNRRDKEWINKFVQSSQTMIKAGDSTAAALFNEYNKTIMPDQPLKQNEITSIIDYIAANSPDANNPNKIIPSQIFNASLVTKLDIDRGKNIFDGVTKLTNNGPACISCHNVEYPGLMSGGGLAIDLTQAYTRLSAVGIDGIIRNPPFPAMINSFGTAKLTDEEVQYLLAFLYDADRKGIPQPPVLQANFVLLIGVIVVLNLVLGVLLLMWQRVKKYSVKNF